MTDEARLLAEQLDRIEAKVDRLIAERDPVPRGTDSGDDDDDDLIDTATASARFDIPIDTVRWLCRKKGLGQKQGNRWLASVTAFRRYRERS